MLIDVDKFTPDPVCKLFNYDTPVRLSTGVYNDTSGNFHLFISKKWNSVPKLPKECGFYCGVCDSIEQFFSQKHKWLIDSDRKFIVSFTHLTKEFDGSFRWHKHGPYIGDGEPTCEFFGDEDLFENGVYTFHVYELMELKVE